jgi:carbon monoxide dehydrogenase subunit G
VQLDHEFTVPVPAAQAWPVLLDIDRIAPCMPGATVTKVDGDDFEGTVKVKVGPITVTYGGSASFLEKDESDRRAVIEARGRETRGSGTATARVTAQLFDQGDSTRVVVNTNLSVTGKPAQFGRGVMSDVGGKLLGRFADCLAGQLAGGQQPAAAPAAPAASAAPAAPAAAPPDAVPASAEAPGPAAVLDAQPASAARQAPPAGTRTSAARQVPPADIRTPAAAAPPPRPEAEAIDLVEAAGGAVAKRVVPVLGVLVLLAVLLAVLRRRR